MLKTDATANVAGEFRHGVYELVGHGEFKDVCGKYIRTVGCLNVSGHGGVRFGKDGDLVDRTGEIFVKKVKFNCGRPSCPICYRGWANREAGKIEYRLEEARKVLAKTNKRTAVVEHVIVSFSESMYDLSEKVLRRRAALGLNGRGIVGYALVYHAFRYCDAEESFRTNRPYGWFFSPHYHLLGFVLGGYGCRGCKKLCSAHPECNGFEGRTRRENLKDGLIVKVMGARKSVFGTLRYELGHASFRNDAKRAHVVTYGGCVSYRRLKVLPMIKVHSKCPLCENDLQRIFYVGVWFEGKDEGFVKLVQDGVEVAGLLPERFFGNG